MKRENAQVIKRKCCGTVFAACTEPECYQDKDWLKSIRKASVEGHTIEIVKLSEVKSVFEECVCEVKKIENQLNLFL